MTANYNLKQLACSLCLLLLAGWLHAGTNPFEQVADDSYTGRFAGPDATLRLKPEAGKWSGTLIFKGDTYTIQGENKDGKLAGTFGPDASAFTATSDGDNLTFTAGTFTARLTRQKLPKLAGVYASKRVKLDFQNQDGGLNGTITFNGKQFQFTATETAGDLAGVFKSGDEAFQFTLVNDPAELTFQTGKFSEVVQREVKALVNSLGMKFMPVPGTQVLFCIWDVRVQDYREYAEANSGVDESWKNPGFDQGDTHPVVTVSWNNAKEFCSWLSHKEGKTYRLPTDAEWSVAVGLPLETGNTPMDKDDDIEDVYPWGTQWPPPDNAGNYDDFSNHAIPGFSDGFEHTSPVGSFKANQFGLYDMGGNVYQWCEDWYNDKQLGRVLRGASWVNGRRRSLLSSYRESSAPSQAGAGTIHGFRVVLEVPSSR